MEQIAMAVPAAQPATDVNPAAGNAKAEPGGLFDQLMTKEIAKLTGPIKGHPKQKTADLMVVWLMSALAAAKVTTGAAQGQADGEVNLPVAGTAQASEKTDEKEHGQTPVDAAAVLMQWIAANPDMVQGLMEDLKTGGIDVNRLAGALVEAAAIETGPSGQIALTAQQKNEFHALMQAVAPEGDQAVAMEPAAKNGADALAQIKKLFAEAITAETGKETQKAEPVNHTMHQEAQASVVHTAGKPADAQDAPDVPAERHVLAGDGMAIQKTPVARQAADTGKSGEGLADGKPTGASARDTATAAGKETEILPFQAAMKAYHVAAPAAVREESAAAATTAATRPGSEAFESIVQSITGLKESSTREMQIQLKPEFLGKVTIHLAMEEGGLVARIAAANPRVQDSFLSQAASLQAVLADQGLKDVRVVVTSSSVQDPNLQQQADRRGQSQQQQQKRNRFAVEAAESSASPALRAYEALYGTSAINYLA